MMGILPSMQYTTDTAPPTGRKLSCKSADHSCSLAALGIRFSESIRSNGLFQWTGSKMIHYEEK